VTGANDAAVAGIAFLVFALILVVIGVIVAARRWSRERVENRRELNLARAGVDVARGLDLETTRQLVWSHRERPRRRHAR
jgi:hypothetical protein